MAAKVLTGASAAFDGFQFAQFSGSRQFPVSKETRLSWDDYAHCHVERHKPSGERRLPTPDWAISNRKLQELLTVFCEERAGFRKPQPGTLRQRLERAQQKIVGRRPRMIEILDSMCREYVTLNKLGLNPGATDTQWNAERDQPYLDCCEGEARYVAETRRKRELRIGIEGLDTFITYTKNGGADVIAAIVILYYRVCLNATYVAHELGLKPNHVRQILFRLHETAQKLWGESRPAAKPPLFRK